MKEALRRIERHDVEETARREELERRVALLERELTELRQRVQALEQRQTA